MTLLGDKKKIAFCCFDTVYECDSWIDRQTHIKVKVKVKVKVSAFI